MYNLDSVDEFNVSDFIESLILICLEIRYCIVLMKIDYKRIKKERNYLFK